MAHHKEGKGENTFATTMVRTDIICTFAPIQKDTLGMVKVEDQEGNLHLQDNGPLLLNNNLCRLNQPLK